MFINTAPNVYSIYEKSINFLALATTERDVKERKQMERELQLASITDEMTGLYNRREFSLLAEKVLVQSERSNHGTLLLCCDPDNLKIINGPFGRREGGQGIMNFSLMRSLPLMIRYTR